LTVDGLLLADDLPIYQMEGFTVGLGSGPVRRRITPGPKPKGLRPDEKTLRPDHKELRPAPPPGAAVTGDMILDWRKENNFSQGHLARLLGVTSIYISLMERGKRNISPLMAEKLNAVFRQGASGRLDSRNGKKREPKAASSLLRPEELRARRQARGLTQRKLAEEVGVTATLIGLIELGKRGLSQELAEKILAVLKE
jgi:transcriptional regulator with XRE-family HTH domain